MERLILILLVVCFTIQTHAQYTYVLVTGVSNYNNSNNNLEQTTKDAKAFAKIMKTQTPNITLLTSRNANRDNILEKLKAICNRANPKDRIIFFFSGHGSKDCIRAYDQSLKYVELISLLQTSKAQHKFCFIDACHAGSIINAIEKETSPDSWKKDITKSDLILYTSSRNDETSYETPWIGAGYFTQALLKGIQGKADDNSDKNITVIELFRYIYNDVMRRSKSEQHPQLITSKNNYDVVVAAWD